MNDFLHKYGVPDVHFNSNDKSALAGNLNLDDKSFHKVFSPDMDQWDISTLVRNPALKPHHVDHMIDNLEDKKLYSLASVPHLSDEQVDKLVGKHHVGIINGLLVRSQDHIKPHHIDHLIKNKVALESLSRVPTLSDHHVHALLDEGNPDIESGIAYNHPNLSSAHLDRLIASPFQRTILGVTNNKDLQPHHIDALLNKHSKVVNANLTQNPALKPHHIDWLLAGGTQEDKENLARNPAIQSHHIDALIGHCSLGISKALAGNKNLEPHHIDSLIDRYGSQSDMTRRLLAKANLQPHHIDKLIDHGLSSDIAMSSQPLQSHHIDRMLAMNDRDTNFWLKNRKDLSPENTEKIKNLSAPSHVIY